MELWDVYDENRIRTGKTVHRGDTLQDGEYRLTVHIVLFSREGKMLIQQRTGEDNHGTRGFLNLWDVTVGGSATAGETSSQAAHRELQEEIGFNFDFRGMRPQLTSDFPDGFDDYYIIQAEPDLKSLHLQEEEVRQVKWAEEDEIQEMIRNQVFVPYDQEWIHLLFAYRNGKYGTITRE